MAEAKKKPKQKPRVRMVHTKQVTVHVPVVHMPKAVLGFVDFVREQGVVGLAIGLVLGAAIKSLVDSMVANIINPIVGVFTGGVNLAQKSVCLNYVTKDGIEVCANRLEYGRFISDIISFIILAAVVYIIFIVLHLDRLDKPKPKPKKK